MILELKITLDTDKIIDGWKTHWHFKGLKETELSHIIMTNKGEINVQPEETIRGLYTAAFEAFEIELTETVLDKLSETDHDNMEQDDALGDGWEEDWYYDQALRNSGR